jgi:N-acetylneuraminic acid mutarotase
MRGLYFYQKTTMTKLAAYLIGASMITTASIISYGCTKSTDSTDELIGNWKKSSDFDGNARSEAVTFSIGDYVYLSTGTTDRDRFKDLWEFNLVRQYWSQKADLPGNARNSAAGFSIGTKGYLGTGYDGTNRLNDFWEYDPTLNSWTQKADFIGSGRYDAVGFAIGGKGYISTGFDGNYLKDLYQYDPGSNTWIQKASLGGSKRSGSQVFIINEKVFVCSGNNNGSSLNDLWMYDFNTDTWAEKRKLTDVSEESYDDDYSTIVRSNGIAMVLGNYAYISTGENGSLTSSTWQYDPASDLWTEKTAFEGSGRSGAVAFVLGNRGFVLTGRSGSLSFDNMYELEPAIEKNDYDN